MPIQEMGPHQDRVEHLRKEAAKYAPSQTNRSLIHDVGDTNGVVEDFVVYPSGYYRRILPGQETRSLRESRAINPQDLEDGDFIIPKHSETPLMSRVRRANNGRTIKGVLQSTLTDSAGRRTLREAGSKLHVHSSTLHLWLDRFQIDNKRSSSSAKDSSSLRALKRQVLPEETLREALIRLYATKSLRGIGEVLGITATSVRDLMIKFSIPRRDPHVNIVPGQK